MVDAASEDVEAQFQRRLEAEKLESLAEFAAGAGHEINNPLAVISGRAQLLLREERDPERRRELAVIHAQAMRVHEMIADLMLFARPPKPRPELCRPGKLVERLFGELGPQALAADVKLIASGDEQCEVDADPTQLLVALKAVCVNGLAVMDGGGKLTVQWRMSGSPSATEIRISDTGRGIEPDVRRHLFDPFYSGLSAGRGLGMGLSKCWRIITLHGGTIQVESEPGRGATFVIVLPRRNQAPG